MSYTRKIVSAVFAIVWVTIAYTQSYRPAFEVASIKPNSSHPGFIRIEDRPDGSLSVENATVRFLLLRAYGVFDYQVVGAPDWINSARYDIEGKAPSGVTSPDVRALLRTLLEDRFQFGGPS
jgi:uncharacterized protein (TIGR03435 family)